MDLLGTSLLLLTLWALSGLTVDWDLQVLLNGVLGAGSVSMKLPSWSILIAKSSIQLILLK